MESMKLNTKQKEAVEFNGGDLLIIAGAGTGKTAVLTQRIIHIIKNGYAKPSEILALTFMEKAAGEMQERVDVAMDYGSDEPLISTFHSFCDKILREDGYHIGIDGSYSLMTPAQSYIFLRKNLYNLPLKTLRPKGSPTKFLNDFLKHISRLQDEDISPEKYLDYVESMPKSDPSQREEHIKYKELAETYKRYTDLKIENSKLDFGDLIILTIKLFREKPNVLAKYKKKFKYILVDEFQDTNYTQNVLVNTLVLEGIVNGRPLLTVVGDDDQAIYKFRGAAISNILQFKEKYPEAREVVLVENYRSKQKILDSAYHLIKHNNPNRLEVTENIDKRLISKGVFKEEDDAVNLIVASNDTLEAERVVDEILKLTGYGEYVGKEERGSQIFDDKGQSSFVENPSRDAQYKFSDVAILVRANDHAEAFINEMRFRNIPFKLVGSRGLYFRTEIRDIVAFLRVLIDYKDEISMFRLLSVPTWGVSGREYLELRMLAKENNCSLLEQLEELWKLKIGEDVLTEDSFKKVEGNLLQKILSPESIAGIATLLMVLDSSFRKVKENRSISEIVYDFLMGTGYINSYIEKGNEESLFAVSNINKYFELVKKYEKDNPESNIFEYVEYLNYSIEIGDSPLIESVDMDMLNAVNVLTVHGSKGLEYPVVFMVNLVSQRFPAVGRSDSIPIPEELILENLPYELSEREVSLQEERRLFYVGATRAREKLFLSAAQFYGDAKRKKKPSEFLKELLDREVEDDFNGLALEHANNLEIRKSGGGMLSYVPLISKDENVKIAEKFSYSQLNIYDTCPRKYEYAYVLNIPQRSNSATSFGTTMHNTLKDFYTLVKNSKEGLEGLVGLPTLEEILALYEKNWVRVGYENKKHEEDRREEGREIVKNFYNNIYSKDDTPYRLEEPFTAHVGKSVFTGKIDRIDFVRENNGVLEVCIIDYKTGREKDAESIEKDLQLPLYAVFAEEKFQVKVVSAKYIFLEVGKVIEVDLSSDRRILAKEKVLEVLGCINSRDFAPKPGFHCKFCDYNSVCEYAEL